MGKTERMARKRKVRIVTIFQGCHKIINEKTITFSQYSIFVFAETYQKNSTGIIETKNGIETEKSVFRDLVSTFYLLSLFCHEQDERFEQFVVAVSSPLETN